MKEGSEHLESFLSKILPGQVTVGLMDMLPDVISCIKDLEGVYLHVNRAFANTLHTTPDQIIGKIDRELFGPELANIYVQDDRELFRTGKSLIEKTELVTYRPGIVRWFITSKIPLKDAEGTIHGMAGLSRPSQIHTTPQSLSPIHSISKAIDYLYGNSSKNVSVDEMARICGLSISSLERHFKKHFNTSPGRFVSQVKMSTACELLADAALSIAEISDQLGYTDPVVFSRGFKREMRVTPTAYRKSLRTS
jgi:AraC-like DNA-binding protein